MLCFQRVRWIFEMFLNDIWCFEMFLNWIWKYSNVWPFSEFSWQHPTNFDQHLTNKRHTLLSNKMPYLNISLIWMRTRGIIKYGKYGNDLESLCEPCRKPDPKNWALGLTQINCQRIRVNRHILKFDFLSKWLLKPPKRF